MFEQNDRQTTIQTIVTSDFTGRELKRIQKLCIHNKEILAMCLY